MKFSKKQDLSQRIEEKALSLGADLAGITEVAALKESPSHRIYTKIPGYDGVGTRRPGKNGNNAGIHWPKEALSAVVIAVAHPEDRPDLDYWDGKAGTPGNRVLMEINQNLAGWIHDTFSFHVRPLPYHVEKGGVFLKDAAAAAGIGTVGKNNLLVTRRFGPRVRLRCLLVDAPLVPSSKEKDDPCEGCDEPCRSACPQASFSKTIYTDPSLGFPLPGREGVYDRLACSRQMEADIENAEPVAATEKREAFRRIRYCRRCELACPVGKNGDRK